LPRAQQATTPTRVAEAISRCIQPGPCHAAPYLTARCRSNPINFRCRADGTVCSHASPSLREVSSALVVSRAASEASVFFPLVTWSVSEQFIVSEYGKRSTQPGNVWEWNLGTRGKGSEKGLSAGPWLRVGFGAGSCVSHRRGGSGPVWYGKDW
jgi:hypothetical protein